MSAKNSTNVTPADVAAKAAEEKLVVPAQAEGEKVEPQEVVEKNTDGNTDETPEKKSVKDRLAGLTEKLKQNKKTLIGVAAVAGAATFTLVKYVKSQATEVVELDGDSDETNPDEPAV